MSDRINHVEQARNLLDAAHKGTITETSRLNIAEAQVHATLEVAEQQRIANLLSFAQFSHDAGDGHRLFTDLEGSMKWRLEAGDALGLS